MTPSPPATSGARPAGVTPRSPAEVAGWVAELAGPLDPATRLPADGGASLVTGLTLSSLRTVPGDLYAALPGARAHGIAFTPDAVAAGAVAVLTDPAGARAAAELSDRLPDDLPLLVTTDPRRVLGRLAARLHGDPAAALRLVGVTGTQGKTTTTRLLEAALQASGCHAGVVGTVGTRVDGVDVPTALTTPEAPDLHALFALMRERGVTDCAMEVSSHALVLGRVDGVVFDVAVFLNLGRDHLDFHADVEEYFAAKASLFAPDRAHRALVNVDDEHGRRLVDLCRERGVAVSTFSATGAPADWWAEDVRADPASSTFVLRGPGGLAQPTTVPLPGAFNVANALAALAAAGEAGLDPRPLALALGTTDGVPGRFEQVGDGGAGRRTVLVDYAHKPDALEAALGTLRPLTRGRLVVVVGAGGDRDRGKRPLMGETAGRLADLVVVTDDNPRSEDPAAIRAAVLDGAAGASAEVVEVAGRREAIALALGRTGPGDVVLVAGKGHETGQEVAGTVHPFDDRVVVRELLADPRVVQGGDR
ncbi:UDP-N-acetylmuramoyl-L-alanyl-D-glutamate--2,6-diaminopimelate ligase [Nocardioides aquaticus]|uniref:UDP-N-acetylmuramoyl-L-alanyl-D-glutamate--2,6-diaminopimelate ligase n=1 Tax=Nocardioides aquaticus TaxID=160826 RepID=A0ABX8ELQ6_9ACTN|nr:UDP-N-acetylmuramoyl-L-alanyl-D-glutamate--2,6-diaminopimelate ligase [Nocardioides aquaticus]QVT80815.1 UDP-N-acetylmuramoyl-L-alanyl-D-glutamate--2,6-diaminopimelate ligase [Nocardioides aquaticus]